AERFPRPRRPRRRRDLRPDRGPLARRRKGIVPRRHSESDRDRDAGRRDTMNAYRIDRTYEWNYDNAPALPPAVRVEEIPGRWDFCGLPIASPLGVPAGPLLNSRWMLYYAERRRDRQAAEVPASRY